MRPHVPAPLPWLGCLLALYLLAPFAAGLFQSGLADWAGADWAGLSRAALVSVASASAATVLVSLTGVPLGYLLARPSGSRMSRRMAVLGFAVQLPLAFPPLSSGILLLFLLGYASPLGRLTGGALTDSFGGIVLAEAFVSAPFLIVAARSAFAGLDPVLEDVAATLGHGPWAVFRRVSLQLAWRPIVAGMLLAWLRAFGEFGATVMVAYHPYSLPVYTYVAFGSRGLPAMLPVLLPTLLAALLVMGLATLLSRPRAPARGGPGVDGIMRDPPPVARARGTRSGATLDLAFRRRLDGFHLDVAWRTEARRLAVLGASGSGKSMTLRLMAGLDRAASQRLLLGGHDLAPLSPAARGVSYVPQSYGLFPHLHLSRQVAFAADADPALVRQWIARLGLSGLERRFPGSLSLGQQQRVALARALSRPARLLLLDEPFSALDAPLRARLRRTLRALQEEMAATTVLVTHDPEEALFLADELLLLEAGRVLQAGRAADVFQRPASAAVAGLLGAETTALGWTLGPHCLDIGGGVRLEVAGPALPPDAGVGWTVAPALVRISPGGRYPATIIGAAVACGGLREVELQAGACRLRALAGPGAPCTPGPCRIDIDPAALQVWPDRAATAPPRLPRPAQWART